MTDYLPEDGLTGTLVGRAWTPSRFTGSVAGPSPVWITERGVMDISRLAPTMAEVLNTEKWKSLQASPDFPNLGGINSVLQNTMAENRDPQQAHFLAPVDLHAIKACGVTFVTSLLERVIEERSGGKAELAVAMRAEFIAALGMDISSIRPDSVEADQLKDYMQSQGIWSQYMEVGIGPYAEVFTKSQCLSAVGLGDFVGVNRISEWSNPEPEVVLVVTPGAKIVGATLGNDVNLRDIEGRSALLLGKAKDNNASCSIGPFIRLFDDTFNIDDLRGEEVNLNIRGPDGFELEDRSNMSAISRDFTELVKQVCNPSHQYPDGLVLFTGSLFAPVIDRDAPGMGFTHHQGDVVRISSKKLGCLENSVTYSDQAPPWTFGLSALMNNLKDRNL